MFPAHKSVFISGALATNAETGSPVYPSQETNSSIESSPALPPIQPVPDRNLAACLTAFYGKFAPERLQAVRIIVSEFRLFSCSFLYLNFSLPRAHFWVPHFDPSAAMFVEARGGGGL